MARSWKIGTAFGIDLFIHWSFLVIPALALFANIDHGISAGIAAAGLVLALFGCVVLHELGHALAARQFGIGTRDITLYPIGGIARLESMPERPFAELVIAVAGPLVNVVIAGGLFVGVYLAGLTGSIGRSFFGQSLLVQLFWLNVSLVVFNMIPAFPMDGGRVLRAVLAMFLDRVRATEIAVIIARVMAVLFFVAALTSLASPMLAIIAFFLLAAGGQELAAVRRQHAYRMATHHVAPPAPAQPFVTTPSPGPGWSGFTWDPRTGLWIQWHDGRPVGS